MNKKFTPAYVYTPVSVCISSQNRCNAWASLLLISDIQKYDISVSQCHVSLAMKQNMCTEARALKYRLILGFLIRNLLKKQHKYSNRHLLCKFPNICHTHFCNPFIHLPPIIETISLKSRDAYFFKALLWHIGYTNGLSM